MADDPSTNPGGPTVTSGGQTSIPIEAPNPRPSHTVAPNLTDAQRQEMLDYAKEHNPDLYPKLAEAMKSEGHYVDERTSEQRKLDHDFNVVGDNDLNAYDVSGVIPQHVLADPELMAGIPAWLDEAKDFAHAIRLPPEMFKGVTSEIFRESKAFREMNEADQQRYLQGQQDLMRQIFGSEDAFSQFKDDLEAFFQDLDDNSVAQVWKTMALQSATVAASLKAYFNHMRRYADARGDR